MPRWQSAVSVIILIVSLGSGEIEELTTSPDARRRKVIRQSMGISSALACFCLLAHARTMTTLGSWHCQELELVYLLGWTSPLALQSG